MLMKPMDWINHSIWRILNEIFKYESLKRMKKKYCSGHMAWLRMEWHEIGWDGWDGMGGITITDSDMENVLDM